MQCGHCLRGEAERVNMKQQTVKNAVSKIESYINYVTVSGGEPTLNPTFPEMLAQELENYNVQFDAFYTVVNGTSFPEKFAAGLNHLFRLANAQNMCRVEYSNDDLHRGQKARVVYNLEKFGYAYDDITGNYDEHMSFFGKKYIGEHQRQHRFPNVIQMGTAASWGTKPVHIYGYHFDGKNIDGEFYINAHGEVFPACDLSYNFMRNNQDLCLGNVNDPEFSYMKAAEKFNRFLDGNTLQATEYGYKINL